MDEIMIKIDNVSKQYRLGEIGGTTLRDELQRLGARMRGREDPTKRIGAKEGKKGETFMALEGITFEVKKGERVGIIGHNGAGKSTLLKLLSRVTAPTAGSIGLNGRVATMLEVGTGFHPELTGRENIYMNGAILGMTKKEIDDKIEDIIDFSECRRFIDTPVKRYSSGMYVKLAFSVAAHLDSEIMIMDEVLAVGDMAFQHKCLGKMGDVSENEGRTVLYVSHNMNTIRQLCTRCIVLDHGTIIYDGAVEKAIDIYLNSYSDLITEVDLSKKKRSEYLGNNKKCRMTFVKMLNSKDGIVKNDAPLLLELDIDCYDNIDALRFRAEFRTRGHGVAVSFSNGFMRCEKDEKKRILLSLNTSQLCDGLYEIAFVLFEQKAGHSIDFDSVLGLMFQKVIEDTDSIRWNPVWGNIKLPDAEMHCI